MPGPSPSPSPTGNVQTAEQYNRLIATYNASVSTSTTLATAIGTTLPTGVKKVTIVNTTSTLLYINPVAAAGTGNAGIQNAALDIYHTDDEILNNLQIYAASAITVHFLFYN